MVGERLKGAVNWVRQHLGVPNLRGVESAAPARELVIPDTGEEFMSDLILRAMSNGAVPPASYTGARQEDGTVRLTRR